MKLPTVAAALIAALPLHATAQPDRIEIRQTLRSLEGAWQGTLEYRDYQSDERSTIPVRADLEPGDLLPTLTRRVEFTDPGRVILSQDLVTISGNTYTEFDPAQDTTTTYAIEGLRFDDTYDWSLTLSGEALDGGTPSAIRIEQVMDGNSFVVTKLVRPAAEPKAEWQFRNQFRLNRVPADPDALLGNWQIDLRPSADAAPYPVMLRVESITDGDITGTFYNGSAMVDGRVSVAWGVVRFAFTTSDGSGTYHTSGTLRNGALQGTTHSLGRAFLMEWQGEAAKENEPNDRPD
ncbi:MAG: hypothetical protein ACF8LK_02250 [Phycisphaerales bacterium JB041]